MKYSFHSQLFEFLQQNIEFKKLRWVNRKSNRLLFESNDHFSVLKFSEILVWNSVFIKRFNPEYSGIRREAAKNFWIKILEFTAEGGGKFLD